MRWTLPNILTLLRLAAAPLVPLMFLFLSRPFADFAALVLFLVAAITDWFDGYLARRWKQTSDFGAFLDPVADKLMVAVALILLVAIGRTYAIFAMIIIGREITISALREWMAQLGKRNSVAVATIGKFKTTAQMAAILLLLVYDIPQWGINFIWLGNAFMFIAAVLTVWSMFYYLKMAMQEFKQNP